MNEIAALLVEFGFTLRDAGRVTRSAHQNNLTLADVQAWIDEARASTSLHNPRGFVRARIQDGDKTAHRSAAARHQSLTHTCACGRVVYASHICPDCGTCPKCCACEPAEPNNE